MPLFTSSTAEFDPELLLSGPLEADSAYQMVTSQPVVWQGGSEADRRALSSGAVAVGGFAGGHR